VKAALDSFRNVPLLAGATTYTASCHIPYGRPIRIIQFKNGKEFFVKIQTTNYNQPDQPC
jgi:hypothetical protein